MAADPHYMEKLFKHDDEVMTRFGEFSAGLFLFLPALMVLWLIVALSQRL